MFAILLSDKMDPFYQNIGSFPTLIYTILLVVCVFTGRARPRLCRSRPAGSRLDALDLEGADMNPDSRIRRRTSSRDCCFDSGLSVCRYRVDIHSDLVGWLLCYYDVHFCSGSSPELSEVLGGLAVFRDALRFGIVTGVLIKPIRPLFAKATQETIKQVLGQTAIVRTSRSTTISVKHARRRRCRADPQSANTGDDRFARATRWSSTRNSASRTSTESFQKKNSSGASARPQSTSANRE